MKKVLAFDIDQTLNVAKTPIPDEIADLLIKCLDDFMICPISGQKFDQFLIQIVNRLIERGVNAAQLANLHLFVAQGTQYYRYYPNGYSDKPIQASAATDKAPYDKNNWHLEYDFPLTDEEVEKITTVLEESAKETGYWEEDKLEEGDEIIENRHSMVAFSALGQHAGTAQKYGWDADTKKRQAIVAKAAEKAPEFQYEIGGTTSINAFKKGMNKEFGMTKMLEVLGIEKKDVLYFGDMTQPGGNDYPVVKMGIDTITVRSHEDTAYALRGILGVL
ncbi:HAD-IIB family hydrolase [Candidatus Saccharibacteria bacterium]|nr:HAD-IIB family hydrolase [Candidatus Saccharibacteria bacterium]